MSVSKSKSRRVAATKSVPHRAPLYLALAAALSMLSVPAVAADECETNSTDLACGLGAEADGPLATAIGATSSADGLRATAVGGGARAMGAGATALGASSVAIANDATAVGNGRSEEHTSELQS